MSVVPLIVCGWYHTREVVTWFQLSVVLVCGNFAMKHAWFWGRDLRIWPGIQVQSPIVLVLFFPSLVHMYIYMHIKSSMICLMNSRGKKQANLTENNLLEVWRFVDYITHEDIIGNLPNWHFLNVIDLHTHHGDSLDFFCASQNLSRTATTTASLDLSGNSPYKTWAFWRFCPENEPNSAKMGGLQVPHSIHSKFPLLKWRQGELFPYDDRSQMRFSPPWFVFPTRGPTWGRATCVRCDQREGWGWGWDEFMVGPAN